MISGGVGRGFRGFPKGGGGRYMGVWAEIASTMNEGGFSFSVQLTINYLVSLTCLEFSTWHVKGGSPPKDKRGYRTKLETGPCRDATGRLIR